MSEKVGGRCDDGGGSDNDDHDNDKDDESDDDDNDDDKNEEEEIEYNRPFELPLMIRTRRCPSNLC